MFPNPNITKITEQRIKNTKYVYCYSIGLHRKTLTRCAKLYDSSSRPHAHSGFSCQHAGTSECVGCI